MRATDAIDAMVSALDGSAPPSPAGPERSRYEAPTIDQLRQMSRGELETERARAETAIDGALLRIAEARTFEYVRGGQAALRHARWAWAMIGTQIALRDRVPLFVRPRAVVDIDGAFDGLKAAMRLLGLLAAEHRAVSELTTGDPVLARAALDDAHEMVERALVGGAPAPVDGSVLGSVLGVLWCTVHHGVADETGDAHADRCDNADMTPCDLRTLYYGPVPS